LKARGYVYNREGSFFYKCHNCGVGTNLANLIKYVDPVLYKEYAVETFGNKTKRKFAQKPVLKFEPPKFKKKDIFSPLQSINNLGHYHPAYEYCILRKIPKERYDDLYLANAFYKYVNTIIPGKFKIGKDDHPRLIIPFKDENNEVIGFQGRGFFKEEPKYITIIIDESKPKVYGLNHANLNEDMYVMEGPIDSMFINNGLAVMQSDLRIAHLKDNVILVPDNEPRNKEVMSQLKRTIDEGYRVVIWPDSVIEKDINDMVLSDINVKDVIYNNTYQGLQAEMKFNEWKRVNL